MQARFWGYLGIVLMTVGGGRLFMLLGVSGASNFLWAMFAFGILLIAREPVRTLSVRVQALEAELANQRGGSFGRSES
jgi:hypothetical protein